VPLREKIRKKERRKLSDWREEWGKRGEEATPCGEDHDKDEPMGEKVVLVNPNSLEENADKRESRGRTRTNCPQGGKKSQGFQKSGQGQKKKAGKGTAARAGSSEGKHFWAPVFVTSRYA